ncbi:MAG: hypothetical protein FWD69_14845 [Polyangiaceae bacterium]|nr:hypothetical protein [Polyangiaceae bacterium]
MASVGAGILLVSVVGLIVSPGTHVDTDDGVRLDAKATPTQHPSTVRWTGTGFTF